ncbi:unnamed protein product [Aspergillus oryzae]|uniref:Unnamed protein product n=1 Tax=Aspergillus oryzae TaxID=5062 RepID=A0AAN5C231_ASPOZ|nr:unnamed protein product [Aspergillus oryzae]
MGYRVSVGQGTKSLKSGPIILKQPAQDDLGGIGLFSTPMDFVKLLSALLDGGYPLLTRESVDVLLQPQLSEASREAMPRPLGAQMRRVLGIKDAGDTQQADHSLAGTVTLRDIAGRRRAGTVNWSGLPNLHWVTHRLDDGVVVEGLALVEGAAVDSQLALVESRAAGFAPEAELHVPRVGRGSGSGCCGDAHAEGKSRGEDGGEEHFEWLCCGGGCYGNCYGSCFGAVVGSVVVFYTGGCEVVVEVVGVGVVGK